MNRTRKPGTMGILRAKQLPPPLSDEAFESLCLDVWRRIWGDRNTCLYGRGGQTQHGVDLLARRGDGEWIGVQCKLRSGGKLRRQELAPDVDAAAQMNPRLSEFVLATTVRRDTDLQDFARQRTDDNRLSGGFSVGCFFWEDFEAFLQDESNVDLLMRHYGDFVVQAVPTGMAFAKMLSLSVGVERPTTLYEVLIGKTVATRSRESPVSGLGYFKDRAFMLNLQTRTAAVFRWPMRHFSDLETAIHNRTDEYIIAKWLGTFPSVDEFLRSDKEEQNLTISDDEWHALNPIRQDES